MAEVNPPKCAVDFRDQPVLVAFYVEDRPVANRVRGRKCLPDIRQILPCRLLSNAKPCVERAFEVTVPQSSFLQLLAADDVEAAPREFAICESCTSQNAKMSRVLKRVDPGHALTDDQRVHIVGAFVGLH